MRGAIDLDSAAVGAAVVALAANTKKSKTMHDARIAVSSTPLLVSRYRSCE
jgi:hypothetical protein